MRLLFGLVSLMICLVIVAYVWSTFTEKTDEVTTPVRNQAEQLSGRSADGVPVADSIQTEEATDQRGYFKGLKVTEVTPGGGMQTMYGLQRDDVIVSVESLTVNELTSAASMKSFLVEAYQKSGPLIVIRNGQRITLPEKPATGAGGRVDSESTRRDYQTLAAVKKRVG